MKKEMEPINMDQLDSWPKKLIVPKSLSLTFANPGLESRVSCFLVLVNVL